MTSPTTPHPSSPITPEAIEALFAGPGAAFRFARWRRPVAPVVFGVDDATLAAFNGAFRALCELTGQSMVDADPELGANVMVFCCRDWAELDGVPDIDRLVGVTGLSARLAAAGRNGDLWKLEFGNGEAVQECGARFLLGAFEAGSISVRAASFGEKA